MAPQGIENLRLAPGNGISPAAAAVDSRAALAESGYSQKVVSPKPPAEFGDNPLKSLDMRLGIPSAQLGFPSDWLGFPSVQLGIPSVQFGTASLGLAGRPSPRIAFGPGRRRLARELSSGQKMAPNPLQSWNQRTELTSSNPPLTA
jgi:hypothetical protein